MGPGYYVIAILGCADSSTACTRVATMPARYESQATCAAATADALMRSSDLDFPSLIAECRAVRGPAAAEKTDRPAATPAGSMRG